jgi:hypothetical protein
LWVSLYLPLSHISTEDSKTNTRHLPIVPKRRHLATLKRDDKGIKPPTTKVVSELEAATEKLLSRVSVPADIERSDLDPIHKVLGANDQQLKAKVHETVIKQNSMDEVKETITVLALAIDIVTAQN